MTEARVKILRPQPKLPPNRPAVLRGLACLDEVAVSYPEDAIRGRIDRWREPEKSIANERAAIAHAWLALGLNAEATKQIATVILEGGMDSGALVGYAEAAIARGDMAEARDLISRASQIAPARSRHDGMNIRVKIQRAQCAKILMASPAVYPASHQSVIVEFLKACEHTPQIGHERICPKLVLEPRVDVVFGYCRSWDQFKCSFHPSR